MNIYLVRHTTPQVEKGICYGQADLDVAETFVEEVQVIKKQIEGVSFDRVFSSPLKRCRKLAHQLREQDIVIEDRIMEFDFGDWELMKWDDIPKEDLNPWMDNFVTVQVPNGESFEQLAERVMHFWNELLTHDYQNVLVSTHSVPIRTILMHESNRPLKDAFKIKLDYGDLHIIHK